MYLLVWLSLLGIATASVPLRNKIQRNNINPTDYILPNTTIPTFYDVRLFFDPNNTEYFYGNVTIRILPTVDTNEIVMHAMELEIDSIEVYADRDGEQVDNLFNGTYSLATDDTHKLRIRLIREIGILQPHVVHISYVGHYADNMFGVYVSTYQEDNRVVNLVTTQMQPTFARRAFPCYDEPQYKAIFRTTIYTPEGYPVVLSNTPETNTTNQPEVNGYVKHEFEDTLPMSTYLLAYLVSEFDYIGNVDTNGELHDDAIYNIPFRVYSRPGTQNTSEFALDFGQKNMLAFENYTDFLYAFPKMDKAAIPDFGAGAMENWGLVLYREVALLVTEGVTTTANKQNIGRIISHENAHMWFGNEVSPASWTYTWLNEGFANYFENYGTDMVLPEWRMMDQFVIAMQNVFRSDAVLSINPMTHAVYTPSQILGTFNAVAYRKSGSVIRMAKHFLTPEVFREGLIKYLKKNSRQAAVPADLYEGLQEALDESNHSIPFTVANILGRWTTQGGFPVITVRRTAPTANSIFVEQQRFLIGGASSDRWHIPINWVLSNDIDFSDTAPQSWISTTFPAVSINIPGLSEVEWFIVNKQQTGYYRVNYDNSNWAALARALNSSHADIHVLNRAQIIDDSFNLARNYRLNYLYPFEISKYLVREKDYIPWASANAAFNFLDIALSSSNIYDLYKTYLLDLTAPLFEELGFIALADEEHVTAYHRNIILDINCRYGNEECLNRSSTLMEQFKNNPALRLNPDIQTLVYCSSLRTGDKDNYEFLWDLYLDSTHSTEQSILLNSLGCTTNEEARDLYLSQVINDDSPVREQDRHTIVVSVINSSPSNTEAALEFVIENFELIQPRVQGLTGTTNILNALARRLTNQHHLDRINFFEARYQHVFTAGEIASVAAIKENIRGTIDWSSGNLQNVGLWLNNNYGNGAVALTSSLLMIFTVIIAILH